MPPAYYYSQSNITCTVPGNGNMKGLFMTLYDYPVKYMASLKAEWNVLFIDILHKINCHCCVIKSNLLNNNGWMSWENHFLLSMLLKNYLILYKNRLSCAKLRSSWMTCTVLGPVPDYCPVLPSPNFYCLELSFVDFFWIVLACPDLSLFVLSLKKYFSSLSPFVLSVLPIGMPHWLICMANQHAPFAYMSLSITT